MRYQTEISMNDGNSLMALLAQVGIGDALILCRQPCDTYEVTLQVAEQLSPECIMDLELVEA